MPVHMGSCHCGALAIALRPDASLAAAAKRDGSIDLIDVAARRLVGESIRGHEGGIRDVDFGPDGQRLASAGADGTVRVWTFAHGGLRARAKKLGETSDVVSGVAISPNGYTVASANGDGTVRLWDAEKGIQVGEPLIERALGFKVIAFSPDGRSLLAGYNDGTIHGWAAEPYPVARHCARIPEGND